MSRALPLLLLAACADGPSEETLVRDVQVIAAVADPPVVAADEPYTLTVTAADPLDRGAEVLVWRCDDLGCDTRRGAPEDERVGFDLVGGGGPLWVLACDPGICDLDDPRPAHLRDPASWMAELPLEGVSLATREVPVTTEPETERPTNPVVEREPEAARLGEASPKEPASLRFTVPGAERAWGYSTAGGFEMPVEDVDREGVVTLPWYAPKDDEDARLYVVFEDDEGGVTVWVGEAAR